MSMSIVMHVLAIRFALLCDSLLRVVAWLLSSMPMDDITRTYVELVLADPEGIDAYAETLVEHGAFEFDGILGIVSTLPPRLQPQASRALYTRDWTLLAYSLAPVVEDDESHPLKRLYDHAQSQSGLYASAV